MFSAQFENCMALAGALALAAAPIEFHILDRLKFFFKVKKFRFTLSAAYDVAFFFLTN